MARINDIPGNHYVKPAEAWKNGASWPISHVFDVPRDWEPGLYKLNIGNYSSSTWLPFTVRNEDPGATSNIIVLDSWPTVQAYNDWGGKSL